MTSISCQSEPQIVSRQTSERKLEKREEATHVHVKNQFVEVRSALSGRAWLSCVSSVHKNMSSAWSDFRTLTKEKRLSQ